MNKFYISSKSGVSGVCKYAHDFYNLVLKNRGFIFLDSSDGLQVILSKVKLVDEVHIEIGIFQKTEVDILFLLLKKGNKNLTVTLHDPPIVKYPFYQFKNPFLNKVSKFYDIYFNSGGVANKYLKNVKTIYVLSVKGADAVRSRYNLTNVKFLPHILDVNEVEKCNSVNNNFIYFGFIGRNKGIEYSLKLHQHLLIKHPEIMYYVAGTAIGDEVNHYNYLKKTYTKNVQFLGYVPDDQLGELFKKASFAPLLFKDYKFYNPFSGSILYSLKKGKIVLTNPVNTTNELIRDGKNGFFLTQVLEDDSKKLTELFDKKSLLIDVRNEIYHSLLVNYSADAVNKIYNC